MHCVAVCASLVHRARQFDAVRRVAAQVTGSVLDLVESLVGDKSMPTILVPPPAAAAAKEAAATTTSTASTGTTSTTSSSGSVTRAPRVPSPLAELAQHATQLDGADLYAQYDASTGAARSATSAATTFETTARALARQLSAAVAALAVSTRFDERQLFARICSTELARVPVRV
jgi:hypothetical protein